MENQSRITAAEHKAKELGAREITHGINWSWANHFPNHAKSMQFIEWLTENGHEHRGSYPEGEAAGYTWSVRWR